VLVIYHTTLQASHCRYCLCIQGKRTEYLWPAEHYQKKRLWLLSLSYREYHQDTVWSFDPSIHKRLEKIPARSQHPTCGKQNDQLTEMESLISGRSFWGCKYNSLEYVRYYIWVNSPPTYRCPRQDTEAMSWLGIMAKSLFIYLFFFFSFGFTTHKKYRRVWYHKHHKHHSHTIGCHSNHITWPSHMRSVRK